MNCIQLIKCINYWLHWCLPTGCLKFKILWDSKEKRKVCNPVLSRNDSVVRNESCSAHTTGSYCLLHSLIRGLSESLSLNKDILTHDAFFLQIYKGKGTVHPRTGHEGPEGELRYSSTLSLTSALDGGGWSTPRPGRFTLGKTRYPLHRRLGGPQVRSGGVRKISPLSGFDPRTVQPVASRYND